jgi:hypothetical protein
MGLFIAGLILSACGGKGGDLQKQMSGTWEERLDHQTFVLKLTGDSKTITIGDKIYPVAVDAQDKDKGQLRLKVENGGEKPEVWTLTQLWEDSDWFNIEVHREGLIEVLIPKKRG